MRKKRIIIPLVCSLVLGLGIFSFNSKGYEPVNAQETPTTSVLEPSTSEEQEPSVIEPSVVVPSVTEPSIETPVEPSEPEDEEPKFSIEEWLFENKDTINLIISSVVTFVSALLGALAFLGKFNKTNATVNLSNAKLALDVNSIKKSSKEQIEKNEELLNTIREEREQMAKEREEMIAMRDDLNAIRQTMLIVYANDPKLAQDGRGQAVEKVLNDKPTE